MRPNRPICPPRPTLPPHRIPIRAHPRDPRLDRPLANPGFLEYRLSMATVIEQLAEQAMSLPAESRARLADILVESLDVADLEHIDALWLDEAKRRRDEVRGGRVKTVPGDEALRKVRESLPR